MGSTIFEFIEQDRSTSIILLKTVSFPTKQIQVLVSLPTEQIKVLVSFPTEQI